MVDKTLTDRTIALAGLAQSAELVQILARTGKIDQHLLEVAVNSLFTFEPDNVEEIYGDVPALRMGLISLRDHFFKPKSPVQAELMRYAIQLIQLAKKVKRSNPLSEQLATQLQQIDNLYQIDSHALDNEAIDAIAEVYLNIISPLKPRVIVSGEQGYLAQNETASKVRVCLLCGLRSAYLWLQKGGSQLQLMTSRRQYQDQAASLLSEMV